MKVNNNKLDKITGVFTFIGALLMYLFYTTILLLIVFGLSWIFNFNFKFVGKNIFAIWTIVYIYVIWTNWNDYYKYSRKIVYERFKHLLIEKDSKNNFIFFGIYTNIKILQKLYTSQTSEYYAWIMKYPLTFTQKIKIIQLWKLLKNNFKQAYEFRWFENSEIFCLFIIEVIQSSDEYIVISSYANKDKLYPKLIYALYLIEEIKKTNFVGKLQKINIKI